MNVIGDLNGGALARKAAARRRIFVSGVAKKKTGGAA